MAEQYTRLATEHGHIGLVYPHLDNHSLTGAPRQKSTTVAALTKSFRIHVGGAVIVSGGDDRERAEAVLLSAAPGLIAFPRSLIANLDLVERLQTGCAQAGPDSKPFYVPGKEGYTGYPARR